LKSLCAISAACPAARDDRLHRTQTRAAASGGAPPHIAEETYFAAEL